jgi:hypothetical protein
MSIVRSADRDGKEPISMPALIAVCPKCNNDAQVPEEAVGKKVKCKKCQNIFVIEPLPTGKLEKTPIPGTAGAAGAAGAKARPKTKPAPGAAGNSDSKSISIGKPGAKPTARTSVGTGASGAMRRPAKKSNSLLWIALGVLLIVAVGAGGWVAMSMNSPPSETQHAKNAKDAKDAKGPKDAAKAKDASKNDPKSKADPAKLARVDPSAPKAHAADPKAPLAPPDFKEVHAPVAPLLKSAPLAEVAEIADVRDVFLMQGKTPRIGVRVREKGKDKGKEKGKDKSYFETYDLDTGLRVGNRFEIPNDTVYLDVDPEGNTLVLCDNDKFLSAYDLPNGAPVWDDDWRPYHDPKNEARQLGNGDYAQFSLLSKDSLLVVTTHNAGDIWSFRQKAPKFLIPEFQHVDFRSANVARGHDLGLSADRTMLALATDDGIEFLDTVTGNKLPAKTPKLSKFGPKIDVLGIGFDPKKETIAVYLASGKTFTLARFQVATGEVIGTPETVADPGEFANISFVNDNLFMSCEHPAAKNRDRNRVGGLLDLSGRKMVECVFGPPRNGMFSVNAGKQVAFAYLNKDKPTVGLVDIPMPGTTPAAEAPPEMAAEKDKDKPAPMPTPAPVGPARHLQQGPEAWPEPEDRSDREGRPAAVGSGDPPGTLGVRRPRHREEGRDEVGPAEPARKQGRIARIVVNRRRN